MPEIKVKTKSKEFILTSHKGALLSDALKSGGFWLPSDCGGAGRCGKCAVTLITDVGETRALACQTKVNGDITVVMDGEGKENARAVLKETDKNARFKAAADVGTTVVEVALYNSDTGEEVASLRELNAQRAFGADAASRIKAYTDGHGEDLTKLISNQLIGMLKRLAGDGTLEKTVVCGNTVMLHILAGVNPKNIGKYPFIPDFTSHKTFVLRSNDFITEITLLPSVSGYIGADALSAAFNCLDDGVEMLIDFGTNCEIALKKDGELYFASAACGPAFEGSEIECGTYASDGAVYAVSFDNALDIGVIGGGEAKGICGSGLIDAIAFMLLENIIKRDGAFNKNYRGKFLKSVRGGKFYLSENVYVSQRDVRAFQLAKSAVYTGIVSLCGAAEINVSDIDKVYVAGSFGRYLNVDNAARTGLLPFEFAGKTQAVGNAALRGAARALFKPDIIAAQETAVKAAKVVNLNDAPNFEGHFIFNLNFPSLKPNEKLK